jgi:DNA modification methylase
MATATPYYQDDFATIYHGDVLEVLATIETPVDAVVTDPPYASGTRLEAHKSASGAMLRAGRFADRPIDLDQMTTTGFVWLMRAVGAACYPLLPDGGSFLSFIDWRQWPNLVGAIETCNYRVQGMVVWDKGHFGLGNGFRSQHELICHASKGVPTIHDKACGNVLTSPRVEPVDHPSPKPIDLLTRLVRVVSPPGGTVLDPFMGSGTTLRAAKDLGRKSIGIEVSERYCEIAAKRLAQEVLDFGGVA